MYRKPICFEFIITVCMPSVVWTVPYLDPSINIPRFSKERPRWIFFSQYFHKGTLSHLYAICCFEFIPHEAIPMPCRWPSKFPFDYQLHIQSEYRKIRNRHNFVFGHFSRSACKLHRFQFALQSSKANLNIVTSVQNMYNCLMCHIFTEIVFDKEIQTIIWVMGNVSA